MKNQSVIGSITLPLSIYVSIYLLATFTSSAGSDIRSLPLFNGNGMIDIARFDIFIYIKKVTRPAQACPIATCTSRIMLKIVSRDATNMAKKAVVQLLL